MQRRQILGIASILLGVGMAASTILGPLVLGVIQFRVSSGAETQLVGGEIVSLAVVAPLAVVAGALWLRGRRLGPVLAIGPAAYALYLSVQLILGPDYARYPGNNEKAFPLYLALIILGWLIALGAWSELGGARLPAPPRGLRRVLAALLIGLGVIFALTWLASIAPVLGGTPSQEYLADPTLFWLVRLMDLGFVIPLAVATGVGLLRRAAWGTRLGYAVTGFLTLEVGAVAAMAVALEARNEPGASMVLLVVMVVFTLALAAAYLRLLWLLRSPGKVREPGRPGRRAPA